MAIVTANWRECQLTVWWSGMMELDLTSGGKAYHDQNAIIKPNEEKKKTRP